MDTFYIYKQLECIQAMLVSVKNKLDSKTEKSTQHPDYVSGQCYYNNKTKTIWLLVEDCAVFDNHKKKLFLVCLSGSSFEFNALSNNWDNPFGIMKNDFSYLGLFGDCFNVIKKI